MKKTSLIKNKKTPLAIALCAVCLFTICDKAKALSLETRIADNYTEVQAGDKVFFDVEIKYPENTRRRDLRIEYQMFDGKTMIASENVLRAVETQASFIDYMMVPNDATVGMKTLNVVIKTYEPVDQGGVENEISATFRVRRGAGGAYIYLSALLAATGFVIILLIFQVVQFRRMIKATRGLDI